MTSKLLKREWLITGGLVAVILLAYWRVLDNSFLKYDDYEYVVENRHIQEGLSWNSLKWAFASTDAANWHPLTWLSHILDYQLYGQNAAGHHFTNLIIHSANSAVLFWALYLITTALWRSAFVAALFALHPLNVESVAWVAERKNLLCTLFWILALVAYAVYSRKRSWRRYVLVLLLFALGLMTKPMVITLPLVLLLLDYWPLNQLWPDAASDTPSASPRVTLGARLKPGLRFALEKSVFLPLVVGSAVITIVAQRRGGAIASTDICSPRLRLENALFSYGKYLRKMVWPSDLAVFYPHPRPTIAASRLVLSGAVLLLITAAVLWRAKRSRYLIVGWALYVITLVPVIGFLQVGGQAMADRYAYIPLLGPFIMLTWSAAEWSKDLRLRNAALTVIAVSTLSVLTVATHIQVGYWKDTNTLFEHAEAVTNSNYMAYGVLGAAYAKEGRLDEAIVELEKHLQIDPSNYHAEHILGVVFLRKGQTNEAIEHFRKAVEIDPKSLEGCNTLGAALLDSGRVDEAIPYFNKALEIDPRYYLACANLGFAFEQSGKLDDAMAQYKDALELTSCDLNPDDCATAAQLNYRMGELAARRGLPVQASTHWREALRIRPNYPEVQQSLSRFSSILNH